MNRKTVWMTGIAAIFAIGMVAASSSFAEVSEDASEKPKIPRYSETCAHGHNGFDCKPSKHKVDISELQERTDDLEMRVAQLERSR